MSFKTGKQRGNLKQNNDNEKKETKPTPKPRVK